MHNKVIAQFKMKIHLTFLHALFNNKENYVKVLVKIFTCHQKEDEKEEYLSMHIFAIMKE